MRLIFSQQLQRYSHCFIASLISFSTRDHFLSICVTPTLLRFLCYTSSSFPPCGNYYSVTLPCSVWFLSKVFSQMKQTKYIFSFILNSHVSSQGSHSKRSGGAREGSSRGGHLHAWGHFEGKQHLQMQFQTSVCFISTEQTSHDSDD